MRRVMSELHVTNRPSETAIIDRIEPSWPIVVFSKLSSEDFKGFSHFPILAKFDSLLKYSNNGSSSASEERRAGQAQHGAQLLRCGCQEEMVSEQILDKPGGKGWPGYLGISQIGQ